MKGLIVANPKAGAGAVGRNWDRLARQVHASFGAYLDVAFTQKPGDATRLTHDAIADGAERIVAVGGDGTVNECVNGFASHGEDVDAQLAIFPAGTGGDLARSIGMAKGTLDCSERVVDIGRVSCVGRDGGQSQRYFLNVASMGSSGLIVDKVNQTSKRFGAKASFLLGTVKGLALYKNQRVRLRVDESYDGEVLVNTVAVANARYFGGGMMIAPDARMSDGKLDVIVVGDVGLGFFVRHSAHLYAGTHTTLPPVKVLRGTRIVVEPLDAAPMLVETDGEQPGRGPATFDVVPKGLRLLGRWSEAEA